MFIWNYVPDISVLRVCVLAEHYVIILFHKNSLKEPAYSVPI